MTLSTRLLLGGCLLAGAVPAACAAMVLAINEGATYRVTDAEVQQKYKLMAEDLGKLLGQKITVVSVSDYKTMAEGLSAARYDLAYVHPAHVALKGLAVDGYKLVALTKGFTDYRAHFLVRADSAAKNVADLKGKKLGVPSPDSVTSVLTRATVNDSFKDGANGIAYVSTRYQDAIPFMVEHGLVDVGVTGSDAVAKAWTGAGGKVAFSSKSVPVKLMLASKNIPAGELPLLQNYFVSLEHSEKGRRTLESIEKTGFVTFDATALSAVNSWIATGIK
ncbi:MAG: PhnD/SsuA/transferrin family substrate-binding protein [Polaromonas sp.]|nr:PhnD/SsuA/transferrin family substrate-binding protein [Polaromonas sp.]